MADCYALEADDFHRRWLPREIFADIGIADPEPLAAVAATAPPVPAAAVEELAAQLAGMLGAGAGTGDKAESSPKRSPSPPPPSAPAAAAAPFPPVCGLEGAAVVAYGGGNVVAGGAAVAWPVAPYSPVQWQVASNFAGGALDYAMLVPVAPLCLVAPPPPPGGRGGTGVFLPRAHAYRHAHHPPGKDGKAGNSRTWVGAGRPAHQQKEGEAAPGKSQKRQNKASAEVVLALPQDWSYH